VPRVWERIPPLGIGVSGQDPTEATSDKGQYPRTACVNTIPDLKAIATWMIGGSSRHDPIPPK
jgi:hypothetical protein